MATKKSTSAVQGAVNKVQAEAKKAGDAISKKAAPMIKKVKQEMARAERSDAAKAVKSAISKAERSDAAKAVKKAINTVKAKLGKKAPAKKAPAKKAAVKKSVRTR